MRYFATTLRGALVEVLDGFRAIPDIEELLSRVKNVEDIDILQEEPAGRVPERWLGDRRIGLGVIPEPAATRFVDAMDEVLLGELNLRPRIQEVLVSHPEAFGQHPRLDFGSIQSSGIAARALTQAVSREIHETDRDAVGIRYVSRHTENEECWAVFEDRITVLFDPDPPFLDANEPEHAQAVQYAASLHQLQLPPIWY